jgi:acyl dehydratase
MALTPIHGLWFEDYAVGNVAVSQSRTVTEADIVNFAGISGDYNEIHTSETYSNKDRFGKRIAHGMLGLSIATGLAAQMGFMRYTVDAFRGLEWEFTAPIYIGDTIHVELEVTELKAVPRLGTGRVVFKVAIKNQNDVVAQRGVWSLLVKLKPTDSK